MKIRFKERHQLKTIVKKNWFLILILVVIPTVFFLFRNAIDTRLIAYVIVAIVCLIKVILTAEDKIGRAHV